MGKGREIGGRGGGAGGVRGGGEEGGGRRPTRPGAARPLLGGFRRLCRIRICRIHPT